VKHLVALALRAPRFVLGATAIATLILGYYAQQIRVDSSIVNLLPADDPERAYHADVTSVFGGEELVVVAVFADDVFAPATLARIDKLSSELAALEGVREVIGPTTVKGIEVSDFGLRTGRFMQELPKTAEESAALRKAMLANPLYLGNVFSSDGRAAAISVFFQPGVSEWDLRDLDARIREIAHATGGPEEIAITGIPTLKVGGARFMETDIARFTPLSIALVVCVLGWAFRTVRGVVVALVPVLLGVVWTTGVMVLSGSSINMGTLVLNPLLLSIGIAYSIHIVTPYYEYLASGSSSRDAIASAMEHVRLPLFVSALGNLCGFAAFIPTTILAIREFGAYSVLGILSILIACITTIPAVLALLPTPQRLPGSRERSRLMVGVLDVIARTAVAHRRLVLALVALLCVVAVHGIRKLNIETDYLSFFSSSSEIRRDNARIAAALAGTQPVYLVIEGRTPGAVTRVESLAAMRGLQDFVQSQPKVDKTMSLVDYLALVRRTIAPEQADAAQPTQEEVDQVMVLIDPAEIRGFVSPDQQRANVVVRTKLSGSHEVRAFADSVLAYAAEHFPPGLSVHPTGTLLLLAQSADRLAWAQVTGLWQVLITLLVIMSFLFLSVRVAILSLIPSVVPIVLLFALMGWLAIDLNISTSLIATIAIGLATDETIHFLTTFNSELKRSGSQEAATLSTMRAEGHPIVFTSVALGLGFLLVTLSNFKPVQNFGLLASSCMIIALVADLLVLPALVTTTRIITLWDLLYLKLGPDPHKQIPLFEGLNPFSARIAVLMGRLGSAKAGDYLTRRGDVAHELYVLLGGGAQVRRADRIVRSLGRGDIVGEMGLVRGEPRSADVLAAEDLEYVTLDRTFVTRLKRRYPWIAATVFLNLSKILSERLEVTTDQLAPAPKASPAEAPPSPAPVTAAQK
jgi:predicted RND superfamily exporter protein